MLIAMIVLAAAFIFVRSIVLRAKAHARFAGAVASAVVASLIVGAIAGRFVFSEAGSLADSPLAPTAPAQRADNRPLFVAGASEYAAPLFVRYVAGPAAAGSIDSLTVENNGRELNLTGWLADPTTLGPAKQLIIVIDGRDQFDATHSYYRDRPDVAKAFARESAMQTGFEKAKISTARFSRGLHQVTIAGVSQDGKRLYSLTKPYTFLR